jgi:hypothetical protein
VQQIRLRIYGPKSIGLKAKKKLWLSPDIFVYRPQYSLPQQSFVGCMTNRLETLQLRLVIAKKIAKRQGSTIKYLSAHKTVRSAHGWKKSEHKERNRRTTHTSICWTTKSFFDDHPNRVQESFLIVKVYSFWRSNHTTIQGLKVFLSLWRVQNQGNRENWRISQSSEK